MSRSSHNREWALDDWPKDCGFADVVTDHRFSHLEGLNAVPSLKYQSGRLPVVHSTTVRRPDKAGGGAKSGPPA